MKLSGNTSHVTAIDPIDGVKSCSSNTPAALLALILLTFFV